MNYDGLPTNTSYTSILPLVLRNTQARRCLATNDQGELVNRLLVGSTKMAALQQEVLDLTSEDSPLADGSFLGAEQAENLL